MATAPLPPPTPMEEDLDYALEVKVDAAVANNGGLKESIHAPLAHPTPIPALNPRAPPRAPLLDSLSGGTAMASYPASVDFLHQLGLQTPFLRPPRLQTTVSPLCSHKSTASITQAKHVPLHTLWEKPWDEIDRLSGGKVSLLSGNWSHNKDKRVHNFVYTFKGRVPFADLYPLRDVLTKPLLTGHLVPNDGWTHAQLRDVVTSLDDGVLFSNTRLAQELRRNPALENAYLLL
ncbi:hypothetical protein EDB89DRAFT_2066545 [Lactarius sanguifluus]|nr:hypothetical protein EDB89DRAFT_2066545 [Lactarius sanguifluus]